MSNGTGARAAKLLPWLPLLPLAPISRARCLCLWFWCDIVLSRSQRRLISTRDSRTCGASRRDGAQSVGQTREQLIQASSRLLEAKKRRKRRRFEGPLFQSFEPIFRRTNISPPPISPSIAVLNKTKPNCGPATASSHQTVATSTYDHKHPPSKSSSGGSSWGRWRSSRKPLDLPAGTAIMFVAGCCYCCLIGPSVYQCRASQLIDLQQQQQQQQLKNDSSSTSLLESLRRPYNQTTSYNHRLSTSMQPISGGGAKSSLQKYLERKSFGQRIMMDAAGNRATNIGANNETDTNSDNYNKVSDNPPPGGPTMRHPSSDYHLNNPATNMIESPANQLPAMVANYGGPSKNKTSAGAAGASFESIQSQFVAAYPRPNLSLETWAKLMGKHTAKQAQHHRHRHQQPQPQVPLTPGALRRAATHPIRPASGLVEAKTGGDPPVQPFGGAQAATLSIGIVIKPSGSVANATETKIQTSGSGSGSSVDAARYSTPATILQLQQQPPDVQSTESSEDIANVIDLSAAAGVHGSPSRGRNGDQNDLDQLHQKQRQLESSLASGGSKGLATEGEHSRGHETGANWAQSKHGDKQQAAESAKRGHHEDKQLVDLGHDRHGWKNVYHREEYANHHKYHDLFRDKHWQDQVAADRLAKQWAAGEQFNASKSKDYHDSQQHGSKYNYRKGSEWKRTTANNENENNDNFTQEQDNGDSLRHEHADDEPANSLSSPASLESVDHNYRQRGSSGSSRESPVRRRQQQQQQANATTTTTPNSGGSAAHLGAQMGAIEDDGRDDGDELNANGNGNENGPEIGTGTRTSDEEDEEQVLEQMKNRLEGFSRSYRPAAPTMFGGPQSSWQPGAATANYSQSPSQNDYVEQQQQQSAKMSRANVRPDHELGGDTAIRAQRVDRDDSRRTRWRKQLVADGSSARFQPPELAQTASSARQAQDAGVGVGGAGIGVDYHEDGGGDGDDNDDEKDHRSSAKSAVDDDYESPVGLVTSAPSVQSSDNGRRDLSQNRRDLGRGAAAAKTNTRAPRDDNEATRNRPHIQLGRREHEQSTARVSFNDGEHSKRNELRLKLELDLGKSLDNNANSGSHVEQQQQQLEPASGSASLAKTPPPPTSGGGNNRPRPADAGGLQPARLTNSLGRQVGGHTGKLMMMRQQQQQQPGMQQVSLNNRPNGGRATGQKATGDTAGGDRLLTIKQQQVKHHQPSGDWWWRSKPNTGGPNQTNNNSTGWLPTYSGPPTPPVQNAPPPPPPIKPATNFSANNSLKLHHLHNNQQQHPDQLVGRKPIGLLPASDQRLRKFELADELAADFEAALNSNASHHADGFAYLSSPLADLDHHHHAALIGGDGWPPAPVAPMSESEGLTIETLPVSSQHQFEMSPNQHNVKQQQQHKAAPLRDYIVVFGGIENHDDDGDEQLSQKHHQVPAASELRHNMRNSSLNHNSLIKPTSNLAAAAHHVQQPAMGDIGGGGQEPRVIFEASASTLHNYRRAIPALGSGGAYHNAAMQLQTMDDQLNDDFTMVNMRHMSPDDASNTFDQRHNQNHLRHLGHLGHLGYQSPHPMIDDNNNEHHYHDSVARPLMQAAASDLDGEYDLNAGQLLTTLQRHQYQNQHQLQHQNQFQPQQLAALPATKLISRPVIATLRDHLLRAASLNYFLLHNSADLGRAHQAQQHQATNFLFAPLGSSQRPNIGSTKTTTINSQQQQQQPMATTTLSRLLRISTRHQKQQQSGYNNNNNKQFWNYYGNPNKINTHDTSSSSPPSYPIQLLHQQQATPYTGDPNKLFYYGLGQPSNYQMSSLHPYPKIDLNESGSDLLVSATRPIVSHVPLTPTGRMVANSSNSTNSTTNKSDKFIKPTSNNNNSLPRLEHNNQKQTSKVPVGLQANKNQPIEEPSKAKHVKARKTNNERAKQSSLGPPLIVERKQLLITNVHKSPIEFQSNNDAAPRRKPIILNNYIGPKKPPPRLQIKSTDYQQLIMRQQNNRLQLLASTIGKLVDHNNCLNHECRMNGSSSSNNNGKHGFNIQDALVRPTTIGQKIIRSFKSKLT